MVSRTVDGGILNVLDIFEMLLVPVLIPKIFPRSASVNSEPFDIVNEIKVLENKIWKQRDKNKTKQNNAKIFAFFI